MTRSEAVTEYERLVSVMQSSRARIHALIEALNAMDKMWFLWPEWSTEAMEETERCGVQLAFNF